MTITRCLWHGNFLEHAGVRGTADNLYVCQWEYQRTSTHRLQQGIPSHSHRNHTDFPDASTDTVKHLRLFIPLEKTTRFVSSIAIGYPVTIDLQTPDHERGRGRPTSDLELCKGWRRGRIETLRNAVSGAWEKISRRREVPGQEYVTAQTFVRVCLCLWCASRQTVEPYQTHF